MSSTLGRVIPSTGLPVEDAVPELVHSLAETGMAVLVAPPGSGKTTVVPLRILAELAGKIVVLEPRRLATRAAARRMAELLGEQVGETVGYVTRHDRSVGPGTRIEVVTEGVLTRRLQADPSLEGTATVVFDEVHERNLQTDLGLALVLDTRASLRPDLRILVMSATIDAERIAAYLGGAAVVAASGRLYPVDVRWRPAPPRTRRIEDHVAAIVRSALDEHEGDVLVFLSGMAEMRRVHERLEGVVADVRLLHGSLPVEEQDLALAASERPFRKVVLATDVAESSLTVEGVSIVVDSGLARAPRLDPRTGMTRLQTVPVSRASAEQRAGRAGRLGPGVAYRLWSKMEQAARRPHIDPEITQVDLAGLALELAAWGAAGPADLRWLDHPPEAAWSQATSLLTSLGALADGRITDAGKAMAELPLHPRLARMVVAAGGDVSLAVWLAALLEEGDPLRGRPEELPTDITLRLRLLTDPAFRHPAASSGRLHRLHRTAADLGRRAGVALGGVDLDRAGRMLALAFPDRLAVRRGSPGRFQLRTGTTAVMPRADALAAEEFVVAADLDGRRRDARIRLAAAVDRSAVVETFAHEVENRVQLVWKGGKLVERAESTLGGMTLARHDRRPPPSEATTRALLARVTDLGLASLPWSKGATRLRSRVGYLRAAVGEPWPDWSDASLRSSVEVWLGPHLGSATGWDDVQRLDIERVLRRALDPRQGGELERLTPSHVVLSSGKRVPVDYSGDDPRISVRVQDLYGTTEGPRVAGRPVVLELLSPAGRPIQVTSDLAGFWKGSWAEVRKEMAGRYPKHAWPRDPAAFS